MKTLNDLREESNTKQYMYEKRESRLIEADKQLGELQQAWAAAQEAEHQKAAKLRAHCHALKQVSCVLLHEIIFSIFYLIDILHGKLLS